MRYKYTEGELKTLLKNLVIIVDRQEKANGHIIEFFEKKKIPYVIEKLDVGDYSCYLKYNEETNGLISRDIYFSNEIVIERKNSIRELAGNFSTDRPRITKEFALANKNRIRVILLLEERTVQEYKENLPTKEDKEQFDKAIEILNSYGMPVRPQGFDFNVRKGNDMGAFNKVAFNGSLQDFNAYFDLHFRPISREFIGAEIVNLLKYYVKNTLKRKGFVDVIES